MPAPAPTDDDVAAICARVAKRVLAAADDLADDVDDADTGTSALLSDAVAHGPRCHST